MTTQTGGRQNEQTFAPVQEYKWIPHELEDIFKNQYAQVGELIERWADVAEGYGQKANAFWEAFESNLKGREVEQLSQYWGDLASTGIFSPRRNAFLVQRGPVTVAVVVARQGNDLYISWRAFIQNYVSMVRVGIWAALVLLISLPFAYDVDFWGESSFSSGAFFRNVIFFGLLSLIFILLYGLMYRDADVLSLFRSPIHELQYDEVASLSTTVHKTVLAAADKVGIDRASLEVREPVYLGRRAKRRI